MSFDCVELVFSAFFAGVPMTLRRKVRGRVGSFQPASVLLESRLLLSGTWETSLAKAAVLAIDPLVAASPLTASAPGQASTFSPREEKNAIDRSRSETKSVNSSSGARERVTRRDRRGRRIGRRRRPRNQRRRRWSRRERRLSGVTAMPGCPAAGGPRWPQSNGSCGSARVAPTG